VKCIVVDKSEKPFVYMTEADGFWTPEPTKAKGFDTPEEAYQAIMDCDTDHRASMDILTVSDMVLDKKEEPTKGEHTPGPWRAYKGETPNQVEISEEGGIYWIAKVQTVKDDFKTLVDAEANGRLLAAAPELLEACKLLVEGIQKADNTGFIEGIEAISKATGRNKAKGA